MLHFELAAQISRKVNRFCGFSTISSTGEAF